MSQSARERYRTLVHIGSTNAAGLSQESPVFAAIWAEFTDRIVRKYNGTAAMQYWGAGLATPGGGATESLLFYEDGRCGDWSFLFRDILRAQGIGTAGINEVLPSHHSSMGFGYSAIFYVKNWTFIGAGSSGVPLFPYVEGVDLIDGLGISGQGNGDPKGWFENHAIVEYGGLYYDPSYGTGPFTGAADWEIAAIDGYGVKAILGGAPARIGRPKDTTIRIIFK